VAVHKQQSYYRTLLAGCFWVQDIEIDPNDPTYQTVYIGTAVGFFKSTNGGNNWTRLFPITINSLQDYVPVSYVAVDPNDSNIILLGTGFSWTDENGSSIIYKTINGGNTWSSIQVTSSKLVIHGIFIDPHSATNNRTIYTSTSNGVFKSVDNGTTWDPVNNGLPHLATRRLKGIYNNNQLILFLTLTTTRTTGGATAFDGGIYKSSDSGNSWSALNGNLPRYQNDVQLYYFYWKFAVDPGNPDIIYIGTTRGWPNEENAAYDSSGVYKTTNGGISWSLLDNSIDYNWMNQNFYGENNVFVLESAPSNPDILYWGLVWMKKSADAGNTWTQISSVKKGNSWKTSGLELMIVDALEFDPTQPNTLFIGYDDFGIFKSTDDGDSYVPLDPVQDPYNGYDALRNIEIDPVNGDLYISRWGGLPSALENNFAYGQFWKSSDHGVSWQKISNGIPDGSPKIVLDKNSGTPGNRILYGSIFGHGIYKSLDSGQSWDQINTGLGNDASKVWTINIDPNNASIVYAGLKTNGAGGGLYRSTDSGQSWDKVSSYPNEDILLIKFDGQNNVYLGSTDNWDYSESGGLYKSTDGGNSWNKILDNPRVVDIEFDKNDPNTIFAALQSWYVYDSVHSYGVVMTKDGGKTWQDITKNLSNDFVKVIRQNPNNPSQIFVGTAGGGLFVMDYTVTSVKSSKTVPSSIMLQQNYPNPFNPTTTIKFTIPTSPFNPSPYQGEEHRERLVTLKVYDVLGREVSTLVNEEKLPGNYEVNFNSSGLASGVYLYRLQAGKFSQTKKFILMK